MRTVADGRPKSTRRSYAQDWASWTKFCASSEVPVLAVTPGTLVMFVERLWTQPGGRKGTCTAPSTIDRRLSGTVVSARAEHGVRLEAGGEMPRRVRGAIYEPADSRDPPVEVQDHVLVDPAQVLEVGERYSSFGPGRAEGEKN